MNPIILIEKLSRQGVTFWLENGEVFLSGPKGVVSPELLDALRENKSRIRRYLMAMNMGAVECAGCRALGYWDRDGSGKGRLYCFYTAVIEGRSGPAETIEKARLNCPRPEKGCKSVTDDF
jgi:hypothetical protein